MHISCITREQAHRFINEEMRRPQSNKVLHAHPSPLSWRGSNGEENDRWEARREPSNTRSMNANFYIGIPYCLPTTPNHCGFCLFPTQDYGGNGAMLKYLDYLEKEAQMMACHLRHDRLSSVYVGGGTPNLLHAEDYIRLMNITRRIFGEPSEGVERTLEGIPQLFNHDKVQAIKEAGFNRVSMGVQQMSDRLIRYSGRRQTHEQVISALEEFNAARLSVNVDLIYGWPEQTLHDMLRDLREVCNLGVRHITLYQLNIAGRSDFSRQQRDLLPSFENTYEMYEAACSYLGSRGFRQATLYDWERIESEAGRFSHENAERYQYEQQLREFLQKDTEGVMAVTCNMVGIGYAAISGCMTWPNEGGPNWIQMNKRSMQGYFECIDAGILPVEKYFEYTPEDLRLVYIFQQLQTMKIDRTTYEQAFGTEVVQDYAPIWDELDARQWIEKSESTIRMVGLGRFLIPMIQSLFSHARLQEMRMGRDAIQAEGKRFIQISKG